MIPQPVGRLQVAAAPVATSWQAALSDLVTDPRELLAMLGLPSTLLPDALAAGAGFRLRVPHAFVARMTPGDVNDPLLRQVLPVGAELQSVPGFTGDPLGELAHVREPGLVQKYRGRVLVIVSGACAVNCRYCFRRHFPYDEHVADSAWWDRLQQTLTDDPGISEVILSGGDPLMVSNRRLTAIVERLAGVLHLSRLRIHTRLPVVIPARVDEALPAILSGSRLRCTVVVHANHARELDEPVREAMSRLADAGITLLNQSVLLRGVNDDPESLTALSERLFECRVLPYYLHLLDPVAGAAHFDMPETKALDIVESVAARLPGYLVPRLVREVPGQPAKTPVRRPSPEAAGGVSQSSRPSL